MRARKSFYFSVAAIMGADTVIRIWHMLTEGSRPIDWAILIVDLLVLIAIIYFEGPEQWHKSKLRRRVLLLEEFMHKGREIQDDIPGPTGSTDRIAIKMQDWRNSVDLWSKETQTFLAKYSSRAASAFSLISNIGTAANPQIVFIKSGESFPIEGLPRQSYQKLLSLLENLRRIIERPEVYF